MSAASDSNKNCSLLRLRDSSYLHQENGQRENSNIGKTAIVIPTKIKCSKTERCFINPRAGAKPGFQLLPGVKKIKEIAPRHSLKQTVAHSSEKNYMDHIQCTGGKHISSFFEERPERHPRIFPIWIPYYKIELSNLRSKSKVKVHSGVCSQKMSHVAVVFFFCAGRENGFIWL